LIWALAAARAHAAFTRGTADPVTSMRRATRLASSQGSVREFAIDCCGELASSACCADRKSEDDGNLLVIAARLWHARAFSSNPAVTIDESFRPCDSAPRVRTIRSPNVINVADVSQRRAACCALMRFSWRNDENFSRQRRSHSIHRFRDHAPALVTGDAALRSIAPDHRRGADLVEGVAKKNTASTTSIRLSTSRSYLC